MHAKGAALGAIMLGHARNFDDLPGAEGGADEATQGRALGVAQPGAIDPETARDLLPYLRNSKKMAPPSKAEKANCDKFGVVSCESCAKPSIASNASKPPSAKLRA